MSRWFEKIVEKVTPSTEKPIIVIDAQKYLESEELQERIKQDGYSLVFVNSGIEVRMKYELEIAGRSKTILVISGKYALVDDMKDSAVVVEICPKDIFRNFDEKTITGLSYNALCTIDSLQIFTELSFEETIRFLLENLYDVDFQAWQQNKSKERCLALLISVFSSSETPNRAITDYLENLGKPYVGADVKEFGDKDKLIEYISKLNPAEINLEYPMLKKELSNLKVNGLLENKSIEDSQKDIVIGELFTFLEERIKTIGDQFKDWFDIASKIGELGCLVYGSQDESIETKFCELLDRLNKQFQIFISNHYDSMFTMNGIAHPKTIDKVQEYIAANTKNSKVAFIVIDGMNYWQWKMLRHSLESEELKVEEKPTLSWLPSITAWARQSIFKGAKPDTSIDNRTEGVLFKKFWIEKHNKQSYQVDYKKISTKEKIQIPSSDITVAGFVINALDEMMHGTILGYKQLYQSTALWIKQSEIAKSVKELRTAGFDVYISTDHGNIDACLNLKLSSGQKAVMNSKSKRFVQFDTEEQAENFISANPDFSLGKRGNNIYFKDTNGFGTSGQSEITHGGSHIMELLIPVGVIK